MWMNRWEIEEMVRKYKHDPVLGPATKYLDDYRELIDNVSDGWPYWSYGTKCAHTLMELIHKADEQQYHHLRDPDYKAPTYKDVQKACKKIETFVRNERQLQGQKAPVLADAVQLRLG
jgi:hypothetical protein